MRTAMLLLQKKAWRCIMAASKRKKCAARDRTPERQIHRGGTPVSEIRIGGNPDSYYECHPVWRFATCDVDESGAWAFCKSRLSDEFWEQIFPKLREFESMTWGDIFITAKKQNHSVTPDELNKCAQDRLRGMSVEAEAIHSLRLGGRLRIYGFMTGATYNILWYDNDHGDNETCVCRSRLKHT